MTALILVLLILVIAGQLDQYRLLHRIKTKTKEIAMKVSELAGKFSALADQVDKVAKEVQALKDSLANVDLPPEAQAALDRLSAAISGVDDLNPDVPTA